MADKKITDLTELTAVASNDYLEIVDTSTGTTKKITQANLTDFTSDTWTPTLYGWSAYNINANYIKIGKLVIANVQMFSSTSNAVFASMTLPVAAAAKSFYGIIPYAFNNGSALTSPAWWFIDYTSPAVVVFYKDIGSTSSTWANSGTKNINCQIIYWTA